MIARLPAMPRRPAMPQRNARRQPAVRFVSLLLTLVLIACGGGGGPPNVPPQLQTEPAYRLSVGDELRVRVFDHPDLTGRYEIDGKGNLTLPLLQRVQARGETLESLRARIQNGLNETYLVDAQVSIEVLNYRSIFVLGEVRSPGSYAYQPGLTVYQVIATAGGFTRRARTGTIQLIRNGPDGPRTYEVPKATPVRPGDMIEVNRRLF